MYKIVLSLPAMAALAPVLMTMGLGDKGKPNIADSPASKDVTDGIPAKHKGINRHLSYSRILAQ